MKRHTMLPPAIAPTPARCCRAYESSVQTRITIARSISVKVRFSLNVEWPEAGSHFGQVLTDQDAVVELLNDILAVDFLPRHAL